MKGQKKEIVAIFRRMNGQTTKTSITGRLYTTAESRRFLQQATNQ